MLVAQQLAWLWCQQIKNWHQKPHVQEEAQADGGEGKRHSGNESEKARVAIKWLALTQKMSMLKEDTFHFAFYIFKHIFGI